MAKLAIDGGSKVFETPANIPAWPLIYPETADAMKELYLSRKWSFYGPKEIEFNVKFSEFTGAKNTIMMANGTVTLELALQALGVGPGDEVIVPAHTWLATGTAVVYVGATPVIVDIEPDTLCMDPDKFEAAITPKTKAVIPVHLFGSFADMDRIMEIARKHNIKVIEDCAHAHGGTWRGKHAGTIGDIGSFSFQQSKLVASGEGGCCTTNDDALADALGRMSHIGYPFGAAQGKANTPPPMGMLCHNYRVTDFQALILLSQLAHLKEDTVLREKNAEFLRAGLNQIPGITVQARGKHADNQHYYCFAIMVDNKQLKPGISLQQVAEAICAEGALFIRGWGAPMYKQTLWSVPENLYRIESNAVAEDVVYNKLLVTTCDWLHASQDVLAKAVEAVAKVMGEYHC